MRSFFGCTPPVGVHQLHERGPHDQPDQEVQGAAAIRPGDDDVGEGGDEAHPTQADEDLVLPAGNAIDHFTPARRSAGTSTSWPSSGSRTTRKATSRRRASAPWRWNEPGP